MFQRLIVPVDGSAASWDAVPIAARFADLVDGDVEVVTVVDPGSDLDAACDELEAGVAGRETSGVVTSVRAFEGDDPAAPLAEYLESHDGAMVMMSSHGHGRSAAVLGSTTDALLRATFGPIIVLGPDVDPSVSRLDGAYVVPVDGSDLSERTLPVAEAWAIEFGAVPWIVEVIDPGVRVGGSGDVMESAYPARLATDLRRRSGHDVEFEVLHGEHPAREIVDFAVTRNASLIFATTHGRSGLSRLRLGSVSAEIVRHARCPVVVSRPPDLPD